MTAKFGPAGSSEAFSKIYKKSSDMPKYLSEMGLDAFEYQCGQGVRVTEATGLALKSEAEKWGIKLSLHSPYFISLSSVEPEKRDKSIDYILQSCRAAKLIGADRIVIHSGSCAKITREYALELACDTLSRARQAAISEGYEDIHFCPETMGKVNQLGTLDEVLTLCKLDDTFLPTVDFGHLNARTFGAVNSREAFAEILDKIENELGSDRLKVFHSHFSKIEYTTPGGEKRHLTFEDTTYGPECEPLMELIAKRNLTPSFICESAGTQDIDALYMKQTYNNYLSGGNINEQI
ncbi:MAG: TIM barrel protein [Oscillospiraceae bacterium]|nr:TIM barrel protein [Ruminococcus sp.]MCD8346139.1 TIM barrel protein [Oscillospiraceae bacterium]